ncbi:MAG: hypothetical protein L7F77_01110 [Candidatus Magnetominusculus sp. LBB02]|nr:hypothetical protein [Candidatus Magnetominusculus sp. LBB02]
MNGGMFNNTAYAALGGVSALAGSGVISLCSQRSCNSCFACIGAISSLGAMFIVKKIIEKVQVKSEDYNVETKP